MRQTKYAVTLEELARIDVTMLKKLAPQLNNDVKLEIIKELGKTNISEAAEASIRAAFGCDDTDTDKEVKDFPNKG